MPRRTTHISPISRRDILTQNLAPKTTPFWLRNLPIIHSFHTLFSSPPLLSSSAVHPRTHRLPQPPPYSLPRPHHPHQDSRHRSPPPPPPHSERHRVHHLPKLPPHPNLIEHERVCPDELNEAISSLLYASSRCGDFPELQEIRTVLASRYGREFTARSIELRNNCGVNPKMVQKLSTRQTQLGDRMNKLKEIASENGLTVTLELEEGSFAKENMEGSKKHNKPEEEMAASSSGINKPVGNMRMSPEEMKKFELSDSLKGKRQYRDVADAAQAAFESAAYAADAARAAVELSRSGSSDPGHQDSPRSRGKQTHESAAPLKHQSPLGNQEIEHEVGELKGESAAEQSRSLSTSSTDSEGTDQKVIPVSISSEEEDLTEKLEKNIVFDDTDDESHESEPSINSAEKLKGTVPSVVQSGGLNHGYSTAYTAEVSRIQSSPRLNIEQGPLSVRRRRVRGF